VPSLEFNSADLLRITRAANRRAAEYYFGAHPDLSTLTPDALVAIAFAAAAVEAFTNELIEKWPGTTTPALIAAVQGVFTGKYRAAVRALSGKSRSPDGRTVQELQRLVALTDAIMHAKAPRLALPRKVSAALVNLRRRGLTAPIASRSKASLLLELQSPHLSEWAFATARNVILAMLDIAPDVESVRSLNQHFRDAAM
jgi:hypothetical protein